jgi:hypothetical protein
VSTIRDQICDAIIDALNTDTPEGVPDASDTRGDEVDPIPGIVVYLVSDQVETGTGQTVGTERMQFRPMHLPAVVRMARLIVEERAGEDDETPARKAVDPLAAWAVKALSGNRLGGLAHELYEVRTDFQYAQRDRMYVRAAHEFCVAYSSRTNDAELKA